MAIEAHAEHVVGCIFCSSEHVGINVGDDGKRRARCSTCGGRFWLDPPGLDLVKNP